MTPGLPGMPDVAAPQAGTAGSGDLMSGVLTAPQRLELVLARHPIAVDLPKATVLTVADTGGNGAGDGAGEASDANPKAVRGAFTLRPEARKAGQADGPTTWTLWWIPIQRRGGAGAGAYVGEEDLAVPLATGLLSARWSVFYEESWSNEHSTGVVLELPAYVKLQVTTSAGLQADWLFEVGWTMGPEFRPPTPQPGEEEETTEGGAEGASTSGTAAGAATSTERLTPTRVGPGGAAGAPTRTAKPAPPVRAPGTSTTPPKGPSGRPPSRPTGAPR